jgi:hypothetical protein
MDNRRTLEGYKYYVDPATGERPPLFVTFLNVTGHPGSRINGVLLAVDEGDLEGLDVRERNYQRVDVTDKVVEPVEGRVWLYVGSAVAQARYAEGLRQGTAVVDATYYESVRREFRRLGEVAYDEFVASTDEPECPVRELTRVDL